MDSEATRELPDAAVEWTARTFRGGQVDVEFFETYASGDLAVLVAVERQQGTVGDLPSRTGPYGSPWSFAGKERAGVSCTGMPTRSPGRSLRSCSAALARGDHAAPLRTSRGSAVRSAGPSSAGCPSPSLTPTEAAAPRAAVSVRPRR